MAHWCCNIFPNITTNSYSVETRNPYYNKMTASRNRICLSQYHYHIAMTMRFVAIGSHLFAKIFVTNATTRRCCNIFLNIATNSYSVEIPSLYYNKMTALTQQNLFVAIPLPYCNANTVCCNMRPLWQQS